LKLCLPENAKMQHIARKFGNRVIFEDGDVEVRIATEGADALSLFAELAGRQRVRDVRSLLAERAGTGTDTSRPQLARH
jgi:hypothetical protein